MCCNFLEFPNICFFFRFEASKETRISWQTDLNLIWKSGQDHSLNQKPSLGVKNILNILFFDNVLMWQRFWLLRFLYIFMGIFLILLQNAVVHGFNKPIINRLEKTGRFEEGRTSAKKETPRKTKRSSHNFVLNTARLLV